MSLPTRAAASSRLSGHPGGEQLIYLRGGIPGLGEDRARVLAGTGGRAREGVVLREKRGETAGCGYAVPSVAT